MPTYGYKCALCGEAVDFTGSVAEAVQKVGEPCTNPTCRGRLVRSFQFSIAPVFGAGGSPGRKVG